MSFIASNLSLELTKAGYKATLHTHQTDNRKKLRPYQRITQLPDTSFIHMQKALLALADGDISAAIQHLQNVEADIEERPIVHALHAVQANKTAPAPVQGVRFHIRDFRPQEKNEDLGLEL